MKINKLIMMILIFISILLFIQCEEDRPLGIYDPNETGLPSPVITQVLPEDGALAGFSEVTIIGNNFSEIAENNGVYLQGLPAQLISATTTQLVIIPPEVIDDSIMVKVDVSGAFETASFSPFKMIGVSEMIPPYEGGGNIRCMGIDPNGNLYINYSNKEIARFTDAGLDTVIGKTAVARSKNFKFGPDGFIYFVDGKSKVYKVSPDDASTQETINTSATATDLDIDMNGNIYVGGSAGKIGILKTDNSTADVGVYEDMKILSLRLYDDYVYFVTNYSGSDTTIAKHGVWKSQIIDLDNLGDKELVIDWYDYLGNDDIDINSINLSETGDVYIGSEYENPIIIVHPDGSTENLYEGLIAPEAVFLCWGNRNLLYVLRDNDLPALEGILKVRMLVNGAPYYGE